MDSKTHGQIDKLLILITAQKQDNKKENELLRKYMYTLVK